MLLDQLNSSEPLKKTKFSLCFPRVGCNFSLSTHRPQKSEMHYCSMYGTVVQRMGEPLEWLLGEPCAVTAGNSQSWGSAFWQVLTESQSCDYLGKENEQMCPPPDSVACPGTHLHILWGSDTLRHVVAFG